MGNNKKIVVLGGGPGGYAAAFLAADKGMNVTLIDTGNKPGGVCLHRGCIPSKALLHIAHLINETKEAKTWGIDFGEPKIDLDDVRNWKNKVIDFFTRKPYDIDHFNNHNSSGIALADFVNQSRPDGLVIDAGCGINPFKKKFKNLIG